MTNFAVWFAVIGGTNHAAHDVQEIMLVLLCLVATVVVLCSYLLTKKWALECVFLGMAGSFLGMANSSDMGQGHGPLGVLVFLPSLSLLILTFAFALTRYQQAAREHRLAEMVNPFSNDEPELALVEPPSQGIAEKSTLI